MWTTILALAAARAAAFVPAPPEVAALHLKETLNKKGFVRVPGATFPRREIQISPPPASRRCTRRFRALLRWKGAKEEDLRLIESGAVHADVATDEGAMAFRQSAAHRLVATGTATFVPAQRPAVTKIPAKEVASAAAAKVRSKRSGNRVWPLTPPAYAASTVPVALAEVQRLFLPDAHTPQHGVNAASPHVVTDQVLIKVTKTGDGDQCPTPEGIHQDGSEVSAVTMIKRDRVTSGGETRLWSLDATTGNYCEDDECRALHPHLPEKPDASLSLGTLTLKDPWETVLFNDRALKHEVEAFDGDRPCSRCVIVGSAWKSTSDSGIPSQTSRRWRGDRRDDSAPRTFDFRPGPIDAQAPQGRHGHDAPRRVPRHARVEHHHPTPPPAPAAASTVCRLVPCELPPSPCL